MSAFASRMYDNGSVFGQDDTVDRDFTTAWRELSKHAPPRRRASLLPQNVPVVGPSRPARPSLATARRNAPDEKLRLPAAAGASASEQQAKSAHLLKNPRRRTIYIPSDDTTLVTIHPGSHNIMLGGSDFTRRNAVGQSDVLAESMRPAPQKKAPRRPSLAVAPRRIPLQPSLRPLQEVEHPEDIHGSGSGKENVPPRLSGSKAGDKTIGTSTGKARRVSIFDPAGDEPGLCLASSLQVCPQPAKQDVGPRSHQLSLRDESASQQFVSTNQHINPPKVNSSLLAKQRNSLYYRDMRRPLPTQNRQSLNHLTISDRFPIIEENVDKPEMFEEAWLRDQEIAMQQLLNQMFCQVPTDDAARTIASQNSQSASFTVYQEPESVILHNRLQASLEFGALNPPVTLRQDMSRLHGDFAFRRSFITIWASTYSDEALALGLETVIGRRISPLSHEQGQARSFVRSSTTCIKDFVKTCLLDNEDSVKPNSQNASLTNWRRTMLRSLMLIILLDKLKERGIIGSPLFLKSSVCKSSSEVLTRLLSLVAPFASPRALIQLHYRLEHIQSPLSEYSYEVSNLATDFRDGVRLTRLIEILSQSGASSFSRCGHEPSADDTAAHSGVPLVRQVDLSPHLILPCHSAVQKSCNVQMALDTMQSMPGLGISIAHIQANDIVNGHREKTVTLLWTLLSQFGLEHIIVRSQLQSEIRRLQRRCGGINSRFKGGSRATSNEDKDSETSERLLIDWAESVAISHGIRVINQTTSFADGRVFASIVEEYQVYINLFGTRHGDSNSSSGLASKLKAIGCSDAFASIFTNTQIRSDRFSSRPFNLAALAFLSSRLLAPSRKGIAAMTLFNAYRQLKTRREQSQRAKAKRLAMECAEVVNVRARIVWAAVVLQRGWRAWVEGGRKGFRSVVAVAEGKRIEDLMGKEVDESESRKVDDDNSEAKIFDIWLP